MSGWRDSYDAWKLASPYDEGGPSYDSVEDLKRDYEALLNENDALRDALKEALPFIAFYAGDVSGDWTATGTIDTCLAQIRKALNLPDPNAPVEEEIAF